MKVLRGLNRVRRFRRPVVTIGVFDGMHVGHTKILKSVVREAKKIGGTSVAISFYPHPARIFNPSQKSPGKSSRDECTLFSAREGASNKKPRGSAKTKYPPSIISLKHRLRLMAGLGLQVCILLNFTKKLADVPPVEFIKKFLVERLGIKEILVGKNFSFGRGGKGNADLLQKAGEKYGFKVQSISPVKIGNNPVSSTRVRKEIMAGNLDDVNRLLARPYSILGTVEHGTKRGRLLGYPTANIDPHHEALPPSGVYAVWAKLGKGMHKGILNIGTRPTFGGKEPTIEVHLFSFNKNIYGRDLEIFFVKRIRDEKRFAAKQALIRQIGYDELIARAMLSKFHPGFIA